MKIERLDHYGRGITHEDKKIIFVKDALPEEDVVIKVMHSKKKYEEAIVEEYCKTSPHRIVPKCPYYGMCGGCHLMHMNVSLQEEFKLKRVKDALKKNAGLKPEMKLIKNNQELFYRNKVTLKIENGKYGYYSEESHQFVPISACLLADTALNDFIQNQKFLVLKQGEITLRTNVQKEILISINSSLEPSIDFESMDKNVIGIVWNGKTIYGQNYFYDSIHTFQFKVSYDAFFQVNHYMTGVIFELLNQHLEGENLLDLYCGVGTLGISLKEKFNQIVGIEKNENAINDAKENALLNGVENAHYYAGDAGKILQSMSSTFDTVIVDPPRSGLNKETMEHILQIKPKSIAYISCDVFTLARDLSVLKEFYKIKKIHALEMFPNTYHVECVCVLNRR